MTSYGYARVATLDQDLTVQRRALRAAGCSVIRAEKKSGNRRDGRTELQVLLDFVQPSDTLIVARIDRLVRSLTIARPSHRICIVSQLMCARRPLPSQLICVGNGLLLRVGPLIIARRYNYVWSLATSRP
jgi:hypothetical protein